ncbi:MAG: xanthine dehydrogenase accessory protein XdhC [Deltaproteobacteria bacterium]|nr:xanthine dehydrogenase accessory protein XdhC [Deltaproteobacteria bacterium]
MTQTHVAMLDAQRARLCAREPFVTVTLVGVRGSAPQELSAKLLLDHQGLAFGTIGGGKLEAHALRRASALLVQRTDSCTLEVVNLQRDIGMTCGGEVTLLYECVWPAQFAVAIFGAGHVSQAVVRLLLTLECVVDVFDTRREWIDRMPAHPSLRAHCPEDLVPHAKSTPESTLCVVMTQGHATDLPVLFALLSRPRGVFVGVMGSELKANKMRRELLELGVDTAQVRALRCPIGLKLGHNRPAEIAVSVVAELLLARDGALTSGR